MIVATTWPCRTWSPTATWMETVPATEAEYAVLHLHRLDGDQGLPRLHRRTVLDRHGDDRAGHGCADLGSAHALAARQGRDVLGEERVAVEQLELLAAAVVPDPDRARWPRKRAADPHASRNPSTWRAGEVSRGVAARRSSTSGRACRRLGRAHTPSPRGAAAAAASNQRASGSGCSNAGSRPRRPVSSRPAVHPGPPARRAGTARSS